MSELGYRPFDCDNHYYEALDAFTRHVPKNMQPRCVQWAEINGHKHHIVGGRLTHAVKNPTWNPIAMPGAISEFLRGNPNKTNMMQALQAREPLPAYYMNNAARVEKMAEQGIEAMWLFPTLGVLYEELVKPDTEAVKVLFRGFNRWLEEDWGFAYRERIFSPPYISLIDLDAAMEELDFALEHDARAFNMRSAPIHTATGFLSPADRRFDPFWQKVNDSGITVACHSGDSGYLRFSEMWGGAGEFQAFDFQPKRLCLSASPSADYMATLICDGLFDRFPNLRFATIEQGSSWVHPMLQKLKKAYGQMPYAFKRDPLETFAKHVWVSPYYEDDLPALRNAIGSEHILFGSDYPHGEGLADPVSFVNDLHGFSKDEVQLIMRDNGLSLVTRRPA